MKTPTRRILAAIAAPLALASALLLHPGIRAEAESAARRVGLLAEVLPPTRGTKQPTVLVNTRGNDKILMVQTSGTTGVDVLAVTEAEAMLARRLSLVHFGTLPVTAPIPVEYAGVRIQTSGTSYTGTFAGFYYVNQGYQTVDFELNPPLVLEPGVQIVPEGAPNLGAGTLLVTFTGSVLGTRGDGVAVR